MMGWIGSAMSADQRSKPTLFRVQQTPLLRGHDIPRVPPSTWTTLENGVNTFA